MRDDTCNRTSHASNQREAALMEVGLSLEELVRRSARVAAALPWLYLKGISSGDLDEALEVLVGLAASRQEAVLAFKRFVKR